MSSVSTVAPSVSSRSTLWVSPSRDLYSFRTFTWLVAMVYRSSSCCRASLLRLLIWEKSVAAFSYSQRNTCSARNFFMPSPASSFWSSSRVRPMISFLHMADLTFVFQKDRDRIR